MIESCTGRCQGEPRWPVAQKTGLGIQFASQGCCWPPIAITRPLTAAYLFDWRTTSSADPAPCSWTKVLTVPCSLCFALRCADNRKELYFESGKIEIFVLVIKRCLRSL